MLPTQEISRLVLERFSAYESGDPMRVIALYADDIAYWDSRCNQRLQGAVSVGRHVAAFLRDFEPRYALLEEHRLEGQDAAIVLWHCAFRRRGESGGDGTVVMQRGMSLLQMREGRIGREECYMDFASLEAPAAALQAA